MIESLRKIPPLVWLILSFSLLAHAVAAVTFLIFAAGITLVAAQEAQFYFSLVVSALLSILLVPVRSRVAFRALILFRGFLVLLSTVQLSVPQSIGVLLALTVVVEVTLYAAFPGNLIGGLAFAVVVALSRYPPSRWEPPIDPVSLGSTLLEFLVLCVVVTALALMLRYRELSIQVVGTNRRLDHAIAQLIQANIGFQDYANEIEGKSKLSERMRVSRDLHDIIGGTLTNVMMMMEAAQDHFRRGDMNRVLSVIKTARRQAEYGLEHTRHSLYALRSYSDEIPTTGLRGIRRLVELYEAVTKISVQVEFGNVAWRQDPEVDDMLYHVIQEGMTNAFRHGKATRILIVLFQGVDYLNIVIQDNGQGASAVTEGIGLRGMRERLGPIGGSLSTRNLPSGFELSVTLPRGSGLPNHVDSSPIIEEETQ